MTLQVPYVAEETIERDAAALLAEYAHAKGVEVNAPIPIEPIIEKHLGLRVEFDDLHRVFGLPGGARFGKKPDIFGAIWLESGEIVVDESLDPEERPLIEERYRFTLAHEVGHWRLHRPLVQANSDKETQRRTVVCRSSQAKERVELQANLYASCLLMPRKLVLQAWRDQFGDDQPRIFPPNSWVEAPGEIERRIMAFFSGQDRSGLHEFALPFALRFLVSRTAMRIRLETLGLIRREVPRP